MTFTTKDLFKILPLEKDVRESLTQNYDSYDDGRKNEIQHMLWDMFHTLIEKITQVYHAEFLDEIAQGKRNLSSDLMKEARKKAYDHCKRILSGEAEEQESITNIRNQLQSLMGEAVKTT